MWGGSVWERLWTRRRQMFDASLLWCSGGALALSSSCTCREEAAPEGVRQPERGSAAMQAPEPTSLSDAAANGEPAREPEPESARQRCPDDMVDAAGAFCIDRYEAHFVDHDADRPLSPFYHPTRAKTRSSYEHWAELVTNGARWFGESEREPPVLPVPPGWQLDSKFLPRARSEAGVYPQGYASGEIAQLACENAGKRLCREAEWVRACRGEDDRDFPYGDSYEPLACNVAREGHPAALLHGNASEHHRDPRLNLVADRHGPLLRRTGSSPRCASRWGEDAIYDMVGNLDEWIDDASGVFVGGFYSRQTERGCAARIGAHPLHYYDYSLGVRCCL